MTGVAETPGGIPAILPFDVAALRAAKQLQQHEPSATRLGPKSSPRATHAAQRITTHTLTGSSRPRLALLRRRDHGVLGWRPLRFTTRPSSHPPTQGSHGRGTGVLAPRRLASPQSLSCAIQHVYSLVPQRRRRLLLKSIRIQHPGLPWRGPRPQSGPCRSASVCPNPFSGHRRLLHTHHRLVRLFV